ncbi:MAG: IS5 family transposase [Akkermansiaceae bacterium]|nr:IS5 family transposase [Akkermansiaceae bacterium]MCP5536125.1 IS5 family transposase [Akkermansiaceae bacterium]MCP5537871.1 IS5 family transposase [Akkermansiaceae bacterium]
MSNYRKQDKGGNLFSAIEHQQAVAKREIGILKLRDIIDWEGFRPLLEELCGYANRDWNKGGRPPFDPVFMLKVLILQKYHGLSDDATEEQIGDRLSFLHFLGLQLGDDYPDAKTIWVFKERIEENSREGSRRLFDAFTAALEKKNLIAREGSIVDASFTEAPRQRNTRSQNKRIKQGGRPEEFDTNKSVGRQKDTDARWTKKNNQSYYGYKNHAKVDLKSKLIICSETTSAEVHDSRVFKQLLDEKDNAVLADSAYHSEENEEYVLEEINAEEHLMRKSHRNKPLTEQELRTNHTISRMRVRVEHVFGRMAQMGADLCRSIGLRRVTSHNHLCNLTYNMDRYALLAR